MKKLFSSIIVTTLVFLFGTHASAADDDPTHIIVSNHGNDKASYSLSDYNRISFSNDGIILSSSKDVSVAQVTLLYSVYNRIQFGENLSVENVVNDPTDVIYNPATKSLNFSILMSRECVVDVFSTSGALLLSGHPSPDGTFSLSKLTNGNYLAVAFNKNRKITLKILIK